MAGSRFKSGGTAGVLFDVSTTVSIYCKEAIFMAGNKNLNGAARAKKDKFYTQIRDIENELRRPV